MSSYAQHRSNSQKTTGPWIPLTRSTSFLLLHFRLLLLSLILVIITMAVTWLVYQISIHLIDQYVGSHFTRLPASDTIWGWIKLQGWFIFKWFFIIVANIIAFYIAFVLAYCVTTPGYSILSSIAEKIYFGHDSQKPEKSRFFHDLYIDLIEGCKIGIFGIAVTILALIINFVPGIGQILIFLLYCFYSCLMFIDYPASRRRWSLGKKLLWLKENTFTSFRLGLLPALVSLIPVINIFLMALLFPVLTVHSTLNFSSIENADKK